MKQRLLSLDALRGFDMFWIIGGDLFFRELAKIYDCPFLNWIGIQTIHVDWEGFRGFDLIFALFIFISGVSMSFAIYKKNKDGAAKKELVFKSGKRAIILVLLGVVYNGGLNFDFENLRVASVLGQIGICYFLVTCIALYVSSIQKQIVIFWSIIIGIAILHLWVPVPGIGANVLTASGSINSFIDKIFLPGALYGGTYDPEGIISVIGGCCLALSGLIAGRLLQSKNLTENKKALYLLSIGIGLILIGFLASFYYPIIKRIWTSTFNLVACGVSFTLFSIFYYVIDVLKFQKWTFLFRVIGLNSITIYLGIEIVKFHQSSQYIFGGLANISGSYSSVILLGGTLFLEWLLLYFLYKKNIFLKI